MNIKTAYEAQKISTKANAAKKRAELDENERNEKFVKENLFEPATAYIEREISSQAEKGFFWANIYMDEAGLCPNTRPQRIALAKVLLAYLRNKGYSVELYDKVMERSRLYFQINW